MGKNKKKKDLIIQTRNYFEKLGSFLKLKWYNSKKKGNKIEVVFQYQYHNQVIKK